MKRVTLKYGILAIITSLISGCGGGEITEPVPLETLVIFKAEIIKPSALYETSEMNEEEQFYFLDQGETVEVLGVLRPGGPALIRTADGEEGWCPDIAMKTGLMADTLAADILSARYPDGAFIEAAPGVIGWQAGDSAYFVTGAASGDFTGDGKAETTVCEAAAIGEETTVKACILNSESFGNIAETDEYPSGEKGVAVEWIAVNDSGYTAISLSVWKEESVEPPLRLKEIETNDIWLYNGEMKKTAEIITAENIVTAGAAAPGNISKGDFLGRFYWQRRVTTEMGANGEGYYGLNAVEKVNLYCYDGQLFEYEGAEPVVYEYDEESGYALTTGEYFEIPLTGTQTINEPTRLRRQPADTGDPIRIIEAAEQVEIILGWPELVETEESEGRWYYVYYQTKESEKEYAGWVFDRSFE